MTYRLSSGLSALLCLATIGAITQPGIAEETQTKLVSQQLQAVKLGETQTNRPLPSEIIAKVHSHQLNGKQAVTLYVRNIPILTFLNDSRSSTQSAVTNDVKLGTQATGNLTHPQAAQLVSNRPAAVSDLTQASPQSNSADSMTRAAQIATKLNQMNREGVAADKIQVVWQGKGNAGQYVVQVDSLPIAAIDASTTYAETTRNAEQDALLVANRLRRILGDATPLKSVQGKPAAVAATTGEATQNQDGEWSVRQVLKGEASWYGPGFHGNLTANGETFNQNAMTAAHPSLAFGTRVRVTNQYNGRSVIVRINDRGPYAGGRIIDLSAASAEVIGLADAGVAPVTVEILQRNAEIASGR
jgi:rare lipoprotein A